MAVTKYTVHTFLNGIEVDVQNVNSAKDLKANAFVEFDNEAELQATAGVRLMGGTSSPDSEELHEQARNAFESYAFNILLCASDNEEIQDKYIEYTKEMRDEYGVKHQLVIPYIEREVPVNHEGIIQVGNTVSDEGVVPYAHVYWLAGAEAGCRVQDSVMAKAYDGSLNIQADVTRAQMEEAIEKGIILFHRDGNEIVVLKDLNSLIHIEEKDVEKKNEDFKQNQTVRVLDMVALESAKVFNKNFLGKVPNDDIGRAELRNQLIKIRTELATRRAIQPYDEGNLTIMQGKTISDVIGYDALQPINAMEKLFLTISFLSV